MANTDTISEEPMRILSLLDFDNPVGRAHWSFFCASQDDSSIGKRAEVEGSPTTGYQMRFQRNYNPANDPAKPAIIPIGRMKASSLQDTPLEGKYVEDDTQARDDFERLCLTMSAPAKTLNPWNPAAGVSKRTVQIKDSQFWVREVVEMLVDKGELLPLDDGSSKSPIDVVRRAPR